jgi:beta-lactam-binding protein with PASTA domain
VVQVVKASYHYRWLAVVVVLAGCSNGERTAPTVDPAVVPSVAGVSVPVAVDQVQRAGLRPELEVAAATPSPLALTECDAGRVTAQDTAVGARLVRGSTVVLTVAGCMPLTPPP